LFPVPAKVAAQRAAVLAEIGDSTLLTAFEQTAAAYAQVPAHVWQDPDGRWRSLTYTQVRDNVRDAARACGLVPGCVAASPAADGSLDPASAWASYAR
jgi:hypothetical protein